MKKPFGVLFLLIAAFLLINCGGGGGGGGGATAPSTTSTNETTTTTSTSSSSSSSGSSNSSGSSGSSSTTTPTPTPNSTSVPWTFVRVIGSTVTGSDKFTLTGESGDHYKGVFVAGRTVTIGDFYILDHEITQAEYQAIKGRNPSYFNGNSGKEAAIGETQANRPVETVSWYDALVYCNKKSMADGFSPCYTINGSTNPADWGSVPTSSDATWNAVTCNFSSNGYRLPTEAEWEYAALGGSSGVNVADPTDYAGTNQEANLSNYAWYDENSDSKTHEVRKKTANSLGLYDMSGNVYEWCWDWYGVVDSSTPATGVSSGDNRAYHGGRYNGNSKGCAVAYRCCAGSPASRMSTIGFRVVRTAN